MTSRVVPAFLNPNASHTTEDRPLTEAEFTETWTYFSSTVRSAARRLGASAADVDDIVQDVGLIFLLRVRMGRVPVAIPVIRRFLQALTRGTVAASRRKRRPTPMVSERLEAVEDTGADSESIAESRQDISTLDRVVRAKLSFREWEVILGGAEGVESDELANRLGTTPGNIRVIKSRAKTILRKELEHSLNREEAA